MKYIIMTISLVLVAPNAAFAVSMAEDIATTIMLRGYDCGGKQVSDISESEDTKGNKTILATCPNGKAYTVFVSSDGRVTVTPR